MAFFQISEKLQIVNQVFNTDPLPLNVLHLLIKVALPDTSIILQNWKKTLAYRSNRGILVGMVAYLVAYFYAIFPKIMAYKIYKSKADTYSTETIIAQGLESTKSKGMDNTKHQHSTEADTYSTETTIAHG